MSNILAELLQAKGSATLEELNDILRTLDSKITHLKISVIQTLHSTFVLYETDLDRVVQWYTEIVEIQNQLKDLDDQLNRDKHALHAAHDDLSFIVDDVTQCQESIELLKSLVDIVKNLERADPSDYFLASQLIEGAEAELTRIARSFPSVEDHIWIKQLRARFSDLVVDVYDKCRKEWGSLFQFDKNFLSINPHSTNIGQLVQALKNIKSFRKVWEKFTNVVWQELFKPACSKDFKIEVLSPEVSKIKCEMSTIIDTSFMSNEYGNNAVNEEIVIKAIKLEKPYQNAKELFRNLTVLVSAFNDLFATNSDEMEALSDFIAPKISEELANKYLRNLILQQCAGDISKAKADVGLMKEFVENLSRNLNFRFPPGSVFEEIETNLDRLFKSQIREELIVKIRNLINADVHDTEKIDYETVSNAELSADEIILLRKNPALFNGCLISKSIADMVRLLKHHMKAYPDDVDMSSSALSLYLAFVKIPKHESDAGDLVPLTSVLIHNNSTYLAHHAGFTFQLCDDMVPDLRSKASQAVAFMMRCVRAKLNEMMATAMASIQERVDRNIDITHDFLVITAELKRLNTVMKGVLPALLWNDILATLVDHTVNEMCSKVLAWDDIPANIASELASAFTQFAVATSSLFKGDASSPREVEALTARAVKKWQRFRLLIFVLTASMKEIESKWVGGCGPLAIEYTAEETRRLVRALFQNNDRRAALLSTIK